MSGSSNKKPARFNWNRAIATGDVLGYRRQVEVRIAPLLGRTYDLPEDVNDEISTVTKILVDSAVDTLPVRRDSGTKPRINDPHLKNLCIEYKKRWNIWKAAGRPNPCKRLRNSSRDSAPVKATLYRIQSRAHGALIRMRVLDNLRMLAVLREREISR